jgi:predicted acetyltransferase/ribosomal protein S18 acetylase RimI-like enzyme
MNLRRAMFEDMLAVARLHRASFATALPFIAVSHTPADDRWFFEQRVFPANEIWLAEDDDLRGFIAFREGHVDHLYVAPGYHRRGIGSALLEQATSRYSELSLWAFQRNAVAQRFYLGRGWRAVEQTDGSRNEEREPDTRFVWRADPNVSMHLVVPSHETLADYTSALLAGWSPNSARDTSQQEFAAIRADADSHLRALVHGEGRITLPDGSSVKRLPGHVFWLWDGGFCGNISFRHVAGTEDLPPHVSGHVGYGVVPWKRRRGYATRALAMILPYARAAGMARVLLTCSADNGPSRRVIEVNGGVFSGTAPNPHRSDTHLLLFWVPT